MVEAVEAVRRSGNYSYFYHLRELKQVVRPPHTQTQTQSRKVLRGRFHPLAEEGPPLHSPLRLTARGGRHCLIILFFREENSQE